MDQRRSEHDDEAPGRVTKKSGFKVREKGALYLEFTPARVWAYRPMPPRAWTILRDDPSARWLGLRDPPLPMGPLIRQIRIEDALRAGTLPRAAVPRALLPESGSFHVRRRQNLRRFLADVPRAVADAVANGFVDETWALFRFLQSTPAALVLCQTEDGARLAWLLANAHHLLPKAEPAAQVLPLTLAASPNAKRRDTLAFARRWCSKKRRAILGRLGFPAAQASVTALAKVPRHHLSVEVATGLRTVLLHPASRALASHLPRLSKAALSLLVCPDLFDRVTSEFLDELAADDRTDFLAGDCVRLLRDALELAGQLDVALPAFSSLTALRTAHDALAHRVAHLTASPSLPLPPHPLCLSDVARLFEGFTLVPLLSTGALLHEGKKMHHCLGTLDSHRTLALEGRFIAFAVDGAMRATLAYGRGPSPHSWVLYDFKGVANATVTPSMMASAVALLHRLNGRLNTAQDPTERRATP